MDRCKTVPPSPRVRRFAMALLVVGLIATADLITKWTMTSIVMDPPRVIPVLPFFNLVLVFNRGVSFGLLGDLGSWVPVILSALTLGIIGILIVWLRRVRHSGEVVGLTLILGGAAGNLVDRLQDDAVTDFLDFYAGSYHWPAFNGADMFIVAGVACLFFFGPWPKIPQKQVHAG